MHHLTIHFTPAHGALVRILALAERRGWSPQSVLATPSGDTTTLDLTVRGSRPVGLLMHQLNKLYDVHEVALVESLEVAA